MRPLVGDNDAYRHMEDLFVRDFFGANGDDHLSYSQFEDLLRILHESAAPLSLLSEMRDGIGVVRSAFTRFEKSAAIDIGESHAIPNLSPENSALRILLAGGIAGAVSRTCTAPLDRLKILRQLQVGTTANTTVWSSLKYMYAKEGVPGLFRGNGTNVIKIAPETAIKFLAYERYKALLFSGRESAHLHPLERFVAGGAAGITAQFSIYPLEVAKTRLAAAPPSTYKGISDCLLSMARTQGPTSLYKGLAPALLGVLPYAGIDLAVFDSLKFLALRLTNSETSSTLTLLGCGAISSTVAQTFAYPLALVRTRLQVQGLQKGGAEYTGMRDCFRKTVAADGVLGLYRGMGPNLLKVIPAVSISYAVYETVKEWLEQRDNR